jgi:glycosyltransferase involved in cell wall biosynthesis
MDDHCPAVSVIVPTYNSAHFLTEALDSILDQTWDDFEIIVIDDGSTDETGDVVGSYGDQVRYFYKPNGGPSSARNMGIERARGGYVAFLDSDDLWDPDKLRIQIDFMQKHPDLGLVCTDSVRMGSRERRQRKLRGDHIGNLFSTLYSNSFVRTSTVLMTRGCFGEIGCFDEQYRSAEDYDVWLRVARKYPIAYLDQPLATYRKHEHNVSRDKLTLRQNAARVLEAHYDPNEISSRAYRTRMSDLHLYFGRAYLRVGDLGMARKSFYRSLTLTPFRFRSIRHWLKSRFLTLRAS